MAWEFRYQLAAALGCWLTLALLLTPRLEAQSVRTLQGTLPALVAELTGPTYCLQCPDTDPRPYLDPSDHVATFFKTARLLDHGAIEEASRLALEVDYELCEFYDELADRKYWLLREDLSRVVQPRGWGAYLLNPESDLPAIVEAPHPVDDYDSAKVAALVFAHGFKGLLIAGTHRDKADVPDLINSVFHQVHVAWTGSLGQVAAWQIHGFAKEKHKFPGDARAILSTGGGEVIDEIVRLEEQLGRRGFEGYVYNRLDPDDEINLRVNNGVAGTEFRSLAATKNLQGQHSRELGGRFIHVELDREIRAKQELRQAVSESIAAAMREVFEPAVAGTQTDQPQVRTARRE